MSQAALDHFGSVLTKRVRDEAISDWDMILDGRMKDAGSQEIRMQIERLHLSKDQIEFFRRLIPRIIDTTLHHLLWTLEEEDSIDVAVKTQAGSVPSLRDVSDGLAGELYSWIPRFSRERYEEP